MQISSLDWTESSSKILRHDTWLEFCHTWCASLVLSFPRLTLTLTLTLIITFALWILHRGTFRCFAIHCSQNGSRYLCQSTKTQPQQYNLFYIGTRLFGSSVVGNAAWIPHNCRVCRETGNNREQCSRSAFSSLFSWLSAANGDQNPDQCNWSSSLVSMVNIVTCLRTVGADSCFTDWTQIHIHKKCRECRLIHDIVICKQPT